MTNEQAVDEWHQAALRETWTKDGERFAVIDYDQYGCALVSREVMHNLLERAGFSQASMPTPPAQEHSPEQAPDEREGAES